MTEDQTLGSLYQRSLIHLSILEARADWGALGKAASELAIDKTLLEGNPVIKAHVLFYQSICQEYSVKISTLQEVLNICKNREPKVDERNGVARKGAGSWDRLEQKVCDALGPDYACKLLSFANCQELQFTSNDSDAAMQATISQEDLNEGEEEEEDYTETDTGELLGKFVLHSSGGDLMLTVSSTRPSHRIDRCSRLSCWWWSASGQNSRRNTNGIVCLDDVPDSALFEDSASAVEMDDAARLTDAHDCACAVRRRDVITYANF